MEFHKITKPEYSIKWTKISPLFPNLISDYVRFGVDPGTTKLGLAFLWKSTCTIYEAKIIRDKNPVNRILLHQKILSECFCMFDFAPIMVIEGSSYGSNFRNTELAEIRASSVLWAINHGVTPHIVPPLSIRKGVFGSGKIKAEVTWSDLPPDAASALACAYYSFKIKE